MSDILAVSILVVSGVIGLVLIPLGLPGIWLMILGLLAYAWLTDFRSVGAVTLALATGLGVFGEIVESWLGFRYARRYGGSSRSGWGALIGGLVGAVVGVPVPVVGSVVGAFVGAFVGAGMFEYSYSRRAEIAVSAGWGAVVGRAAAAAVKIALGLVIAVIALFAMLRG